MRFKRLFLFPATLALLGAAPHCAENFGAKTIDDCRREQDFTAVCYINAGELITACRNSGRTDCDNIAVGALFACPPFTSTECGGTELFGGD